MTLYGYSEYIMIAKMKNSYESSWYSKHQRGTFVIRTSEFTENKNHCVVYMNKWKTDKYFGI